MIKTLKIPLFPTNEQEIKLLKFSNTSRFIYNWGLGEKKKAYEERKENLKLQDLIKLLQDLKYNNPDYLWIQEVPESVTKQSLKDLIKAYDLFFKRGNKGFPKFKAKNRTPLSFYQRTDNLYYIEETNRVNITGIGKVKVNNHYGYFPKKPQNPRIKYDGKHWYLTVGMEVENDKDDLTDLVLGVDLGITKLAVRSDGIEVSNINKSKKVKKLEKKKKRLQRQVSKKYEKNKQGSKFIKTNNIKKLESEIKLLNRKLTNIRNNHIHEATSNIVKTKPCRVVVEDLNVMGMMKNKYLSKSIQEQGFNQFQNYLEYKCNSKGIEFIKADRYYPSSKLCSHCGNKKVDLKLSDRVYKCVSCGLEIDRDLNAALNLSNYQSV